MSKRDLTDTERKAWSAVTRHVAPLKGRRGAPPGSCRNEPNPPASPAIVSAVRQHAPPQNRQNERLVRRGKQEISASLDLHGHTQDSAWRLLPSWLRNQQAMGARCVIVITGKGKAGGGVLRRNFLTWLESPEARPVVSGFAPAHARHGGSGAWYVFLRRL